MSTTPKHSPILTNLNNDAILLFIFVWGIRFSIFTEWYHWYKFIWLIAKVDDNLAYRLAIVLWKHLFIINVIAWHLSLMAVEIGLGVRRRNKWNNGWWFSGVLVLSDWFHLFD
jgi:hypothetical protein